MAEDRPVSLKKKISAQLEYGAQTAASGVIIAGGITMAAMLPLLPGAAVLAGAFAVGSWCLKRDKARRAARLRGEDFD